jgi:hypothetical protein
MEMSIVITISRQPKKPACDYGSAPLYFFKYPLLTGFPSFCTVLKIKVIGPGFVPLVLMRGVAFALPPGITAIFDTAH